MILTCVPMSSRDPARDVARDIGLYICEFGRLNGDSLPCMGVYVPYLSPLPGDMTLSVGGRWSTLYASCGYLK